MSMKSAARMALVAAAAYPLGRYHKLRWALMVAALAATGRLESPGQFVLRGVKDLANSPELSELTDAVRGQLLGAARDAAISAASTSIGSLTDRVNDQTEALRKGGAEAAEGVSKAASLSSTEDDDGETDEPESAEADGSADEERPRRRQPVSSGSTASPARQGDSAKRRRRQATDSHDGHRESRPERRPARSESHGGGSPVRRKG
jgi:hypothetical protein